MLELGGVLDTAHPLPLLAAVTLHTPPELLLLLVGVLPWAAESISYFLFQDVSGMPTFTYSSILMKQSRNVEDLACHGDALVNELVVN